jgi:hypothetical protein
MRTVALAALAAMLSLPSVAGTQCSDIRASWVNASNEAVTLVQETPRLYSLMKDGKKVDTISVELDLKVKHDFSSQAKVPLEISSTVYFLTADKRQRFDFAQSDAEIRSDLAATHYTGTLGPLSPIWRKTCPAPIH